MNRIITISREFGSGGREIGWRLAEKLKIAYYDQEIVSELMKRTDFAEDYIRRIEEKQEYHARTSLGARSIKMRHFSQFITCHVHSG